MNTEPKRLLKMLDTEAADNVQPSIITGEPIEYTCDGITRNDLVMDKTDFSITVKQPTCRLTIPIEYTTIYQREKERLDMARPKKTQERVSQPPAIHPSEMQQPPQQLPGHDAAGNLMLPPGSIMAITAFPLMPMPTGTPTPYADLVAPVRTAGNPNIVLEPKPVREVTINQVQGDPDWINKAIEDMAGTLIDTLRNLVESVTADAAEDETDVPKTCFQCVHIDIEGNKCAKFNTLPPLFVIAAPEGKCNEFVDGGSDVPM